MAGLGRGRAFGSDRARRLSALRRFFRFLLAEGVRADDPTALLDAPRLGRGLPKYLTEAEVSALLGACEGRPMARAALEVLYATGLRVSEVLSLRRGALRRDSVVVRGKGGKERMVLLTQAAQGGGWGVGGRVAGGVRLAVSREGQAPGDDPAGLRAGAEAGGAGGRGWIRGGFHRMCCGIRLPRICWRGGRICGACRCCWVMRISRRRRFIRMWSRSG